MLKLFLKKSILGGILFIIVATTFVFASWWNPMTWFKKSTPVVMQQQNKQIMNGDVKSKVNEVTTQGSDDGFVEGVHGLEVSFPSNIAGKLAYEVEQEKREVEFKTNMFKFISKLRYEIKKKGKSFIIYDGKEIGKEYDATGLPFEVSGKLAYYAQNIKYKNTIESFFVYDGKEVGKEYGSKGYIVRNLVEVSGKLAYEVTKDSHSFVVYDGKEIGREYFQAFDPFVLYGKLAYKVIDGHSFIVYDGKEIGKEYEQVLEFIGVSGKLAYIARTGSTYFLIYDGKQIGKEYRDFSNIKEIAGKLTYEARTYDEKYFIVYDGKEIGKEYNYASNPTEVLGKLAYEVLNVKDKNTRELFAVYDGKEIGKEYISKGYRVKNLVGVSGKLTYEVEKDGKSFFVYDGKEIGKEYNNKGYNVRNLFEVSGKLAYEVTKDSHSFIVYDGKEIGKGYDSVSSAIAVDGKLTYVARRGAESFIVIEK